MLELNRRQLLRHSSAAAGLTLAGLLQPIENSHAVAPAKTTEPRYCLNTSTIRGHKIPLDQEIDLIAKAGYSGIEPWIGEIQAIRESGQKLSDIRKRLEDHNLQVESAIGFANWIVDDDAKRQRGLEDLKRDMDLVRQIGGTRIAAPPAGGTGSAINLDRVAERYRDALRAGRELGVTPLVELWGPSASLHRLGELMYVIVESGDPDASLLLDVYHIYRGGSDFDGLRFVDGRAVKVLHMNDYPDIPQAQIKDADRVYPGAGIAPIPDILRVLQSTGFEGVLSLELFNPSYWKDDVENVLKRGLASMKQVVAAI